jgi:hypothetical protein
MLELTINPNNSGSFLASAGAAARTFMEDEQAIPNLGASELRISNEAEMGMFADPSFGKGLMLTKWLTGFIDQIAVIFNNSGHPKLADFFRTMIPNSKASDSPSTTTAMEALHKSFNAEYHNCAGSGNIARMLEMEVAYPQIAADNAFYQSIIEALEQKQGVIVDHLLDPSLYVGRKIEFKGENGKNETFWFGRFLERFLKHSSVDQFSKLIDLIKANPQIYDLLNKNDTLLFGFLFRGIVQIPDAGNVDRKTAILTELYEKFPGVELTRKAFEAAEPFPEVMHNIGDTYWSTMAVHLEGTLYHSSVDYKGTHEQFGYSVDEFQPVPAPF